MDNIKAMAAFSALSQETRLEVFRLLIKAGSKGMLAGELGEALGVKQNTMSANLNVLVQAGLLKNEREGRNIHYYIDQQNLQDLLAFLLEDCCGGQPEVCKPIIDNLINCC